MEEIIHILTATPILENDYNDLANEALQRTKTKYEEKEVIFQFDGKEFKTNH